MVWDDVIESNSGIYDLQAYISWHALLQCYNEQAFVVGTYEQHSSV